MPFWRLRFTLTFWSFTFWILLLLSSKKGFFFILGDKSRMIYLHKGQMCLKIPTTMKTWHFLQKVAFLYCRILELDLREAPTFDSVRKIWKLDENWTFQFEKFKYCRVRFHKPLQNWNVIQNQPLPGLNPAN